MSIFSSCFETTSLTIYELLRSDKVSYVSAHASNQGRVKSVVPSYEIPISTGSDTCIDLKVLKRCCELSIDYMPVVTRVC